MKMSEQRHGIFARSNEKEHDEASPSLFSSASANDAFALPTHGPEPPIDVATNEPPVDSDHGARHDASNERGAAPSPQAPQRTGWSKDDVALAVVLPVVLSVLACVSLRHCYVANRRHAHFHDRRRSVRAAQRAEDRERRRLRETARRERAREVEAALVSKTASACNCSSAITKCASTSDFTMHTNVTDDTSTCSSNHDVESPAMADNENDDESSSCQICAICLEPYVVGKDKVSWSKFQTCRHAFHHKCIRGWLEETKNAGNCPCCRGPCLKEEETEQSEEIEVTLNEESDRRDETNVDEENQGNSDTVQTEGGRDAAGGRDDENGMLDVGGDDEERPGDSNAQTLDEEVPVVGSRIVTSVLDANSPSYKANNVAMGSEFTSFCIIHGLIRDTKRGNVFLSIKPIDEPAALGSDAWSPIFET